MIISLGVVAALCHKEGSPAELIDQADQQLYKAEAGGRKQVVSKILPSNDQYPI